MPPEAPETKGEKMDGRELLQERGEVIDHLAEEVEGREVRSFNNPPGTVEGLRTQANSLTRRVEALSGVELTTIETLADLRVARLELDESGVGGLVMDGARRRAAETKGVTR